MPNPLPQCARFELGLYRWLTTHAMTLLRVAIGLVFLIFGACKYVPGLSPIEALVKQTTTALTFGLVPPDLALIMVATLECVIGICFLTGRFLRVGIVLMLFQMTGAMSPLVLFAAQLFPGPGLHITLNAQYIVKDIILIAAALVIAATRTRPRLVAAPRRSARTDSDGTREKVTAA